MNPITLSDVLIHSGIASVFIGTGACVRGICHHTFSQHARAAAVLFTLLFVLIEATAQVWLVG